MEMGPNSARWIYANDRFAIAVRVVTSLDAPVCRLTIDVERGGPVELLITHDLVLGENEHEAGVVKIDRVARRVTLRPAQGSRLRLRYPSSTFFIVSPDPDAIDAIGRDELLYADGIRRDGEFIVVRTKPVTHVSLALTGSIVNASRAAALAAEIGPDPEPDGVTTEGCRPPSGRASVGVGCSAARRGDGRTMSHASTTSSAGTSTTR